MKVCLLTTSYMRHAKDGFASFLHSYVKSLIKKDMEVVIVTSSDKVTRDEELLVNKNMSIKRFDYFFPRSMQRLTYNQSGGMPQNIKANYIAKLQFPLFVLSFLLKSLKYSKDCDIVHAHWIISGFAGLFSKWLYKKKVILTVRENDVGILTKHALCRMVLNAVDIVAVNNDHYKAEIEKVLKKKNKLVKIHNGVESRFQPYDREMSRKKLDLPLDKIIVLFTGTLIPRKGPQDMVEAAVRILEEPNLKKSLLFVFAGTGILEDELKKAVEDRGVPSNFLFKGKQPYEQMHYWYNASDVFVLPTYADGIPNSLKEAMKCGIPSVTTNISGIPEVVIDNKTGFIVTPGDIDLLKKRIKLLVTDKDMRTRLGANSRNIILEKGFDWDISAGKYIEVYKRLI